MWAGAPQWASWALQPQQYQNMNHDEVDWAALAKQWIQMKETVDVPPLPPSSLQVPTNSASFSEPNSAKQISKNEDPPSFISQQPPPPPPGPPPPTQQFHAATIKAEDEGELHLGGEMDMEIEDDKDNISNGELGHPAMPSANNSDELCQEWWNGTQAPATGWGWGWGPVDATHPVVPDLEPPGTSEPISQAHYTSKQHQMGDYNWNHDMMPDADQIAMRGVTDYGHRSRRSKPPFTVDPSLESEKEADFHLDAAQRKKLPLWIREGLEKMEREKQRKFEREREVMHKEEMLRRKKEAEKQARKILKEGFVTDGVGNIVPAKSKFESDSDESNHSDQEHEDQTPVIIKKNSRFDVAPPSDVKERLSNFKEEPEGEIGIKFGKLTEEEKLAQMMTKLRRWMTEILLDVTTSMIHEVASEVISKARIRAPQVQVKKSSALTSLSRGLGLSIYSDSEDETSDDGGKRNGTQQGEDSDSDETLREVISRKKKEFEVTEKEILQKLQKFEEESRTREMSVESARSSNSRSSPIQSDQEENLRSRSPSIDKLGNDEKPAEESLDKPDPSEESDDSDSQSDSERKTDDSSTDDKDGSHESSDDEKESSEEEVTKKKIKRRSHSQDRKFKRSSSRDSKLRQSTSRERISDRSASRDRKSKRSLSRERKLKKSESREGKSKRSNSRERKSKRLSSQERKYRRSFSRERISKERKSRRSISRDRKPRQSTSMERRSRRSISRERMYMMARYREDRHRRQYGRTSRSPHRRRKRSGSRSNRRSHSRNRSLSAEDRPISLSRERRIKRSIISSRAKGYNNHSGTRSRSRDTRPQRSLSRDRRLRRSVSEERHGSHMRSRHVSSRRRSSRNVSPVMIGGHSSRSSSRSRRKRRAKKRSSSSSSSSMKKANLHIRRSSSSGSSSEENRAKRKKRKKNRRHSSRGSSS